MATVELYRNKGLVMEAHLRIFGADGLYKSLDRHEQPIFNVLLHGFFSHRQSHAPSIVSRRHEGRKCSLDFSPPQGKIFLEPSDRPTFGNSYGWRGVLAILRAPCWRTLPDCENL
ncbi:MAG: hypothetical protein LCH99_08610 [Proteobacteria bacterium]|nr:hypothetical protein [Pseudomonadota bacterium]